MHTYIQISIYCNFLNIYFVPILLYLFDFIILFAIIIALIITKNFKMNKQCLCRIIFTIASYSKFWHVLRKWHFSVHKRSTIFKQSFLRVGWNVSFPKVNPISAQFRTIENKTWMRSWFANDWIQIIKLLIRCQNGSFFFSCTIKYKKIFSLYVYK